MAFAVASKRAPLAVAVLFRKLLLGAAPSGSGAAPADAALRPACAAVPRRLFSTGGAPFRGDGDYSYSSSKEEYIGDEEVVCDRVRSPRGFTYVEDPCACDKPMCLCGRPLEEAAAPRRGCVVLGAVWRSKEDADAVKLKVAMPGLGKEHVKVWTDQDELAIEGEADKDAEYDDDDEDPAWYGHRIEFPADTFKLDQIKVDMKDGVLKVTVPKIKLEERKDVFQVKVE